MCINLVYVLIKCVLTLVYFLIKCVLTLVYVDRRLCPH